MSEFITTTADDRDDDGEGLAAQRELDAFVEECEPEFIDGKYYGCGACGPCLDQADSEGE